MMNRKVGLEINHIAVVEMETDYNTRRWVMSWVRSLLEALGFVAAGLACFAILAAFLVALQ